MDLSDDDLKQVFCLLHSIAFEPYVKAFKYKILNSIPYTYYNLSKTGYIQDDSCSFCKTEPETLHHFFSYCTHARRFDTSSNLIILTEQISQCLYMHNFERHLRRDHKLKMSFIKLCITYRKIVHVGLSKEQ